MHSRGILKGTDIALQGKKQVLLLFLLLKNDQSTLPPIEWQKASPLSVCRSHIAQQEGWLYLAGELDLCSRRLIGWKVGRPRESKEPGVYKSTLAMTEPARWQ